MKRMDENRPMPLSELSGYIESVRRDGQGDYVPVVEMGMIKDDQAFRWLRFAVYASAACVLIAFGGLFAVSASTGSLTIASGLDAGAVAVIVSEEVGRVFSVVQNEDGTYRVRFFSLRDSRSLLERLKANREFESVELKD
jgi:hypothetical protein